MFIAKAAKRGLLIFLGIISFQLMGMKNSLSPQQKMQKLVLAEKMINRRKDFLKNKINEYAKKVRNALSIEDKQGLEKVLQKWINELDGLESWIASSGVDAVGTFLAEEFIENKTKNQRFFDEEPDDDEDSL